MRAKVTLPDRATTGWISLPPQLDRDLIRQAMPHRDQNLTSSEALLSGAVAATIAYPSAALRLATEISFPEQRLQARLGLRCPLTDTWVLEAL